MNIVDFLNNSPSSYCAIDTITKILDENNYIKLDEKEDFNLLRGNKYYVTRNDSSIIAFNVGSRLDVPHLELTASHSDCPSFVLKPNSLVYENGYLKLNVEMYGGIILYSWFDRPLSIAGRIIYKEDGKVKSMPYVYKKPFCIIPSLAIHLNRNINNDLKLNPQIDLMPLVSLEKKDIKEFLKEDINKEVISYDLFLYPLEKAYIWGKDDEFISSQHLDDLMCSYTCLMGFLNNFNDENLNVYCCFDNEEIGSSTRQGADSDFLTSTLKRICKSLKIDYYKLLAKGYMLSCDNAHGLHPNHIEKYDLNNRCFMNKGIVIKHELRAYTSDGLSLGLFINLLDENKIPYQFFANRSDNLGGSTLGNISNNHSSLLSLDIGLAQLSMHSAIETAGYKDIDYMIDAIKAFYNTNLID